jgi:hypothetical protein
VSPASRVSGRGAPSAGSGRVGCRRLRIRRTPRGGENVLIGAGFTDHGRVFCRPHGGPLHPERFS